MGRKSKSLRLKVYINNRQVGMLERIPTGALSFRYSESWLSFEKSMDISYSLPRRLDTYSGPEVYNFFENLLPDNPGIRRTIAERIGAQSSEVTDLLQYLGRDCVGAIQILPETSDVSTKIPDVSGNVLSENEIESILKNLSSNPLGMRKDLDFRLSLAGAQEKTALLQIGKKWYLPQGTVPTTHIFKKNLGKLSNGIDMSNSVENEWLSLLICKKLGLPVVNAEIARFGSVPCLIIERFDRQWSDDKKKLYRIPTEDICQALGVSVTKKYENEGGPGIKDTMDFLTASNKSQEDREVFIKAQIIFHLLAAIDGHAKNFSIFIGPQGMQLTPIYDVLTAYPAFMQKQIERKEMKLAMAVGDSRKYRLSEIQKRHWQQTAKKCNFDNDFLEKIFQDIRISYKEMNIEKEIPHGFSQDVLDSTLNNLKISVEKFSL